MSAVFKQDADAGGRALAKKARTGSASWFPRRHADKLPGGIQVFQQGKEKKCCARPDNPPCFPQESRFGALCIFAICCRPVKRKSGSKQGPPPSSPRGGPVVKLLGAENQIFPVRGLKIKAPLAFVKKQARHKLGEAHPPRRGNRLPAWRRRAPRAPAGKGVIVQMPRPFGLTHPASGSEASLWSCRREARKRWASFAAARYLRLAQNLESLARAAIIRPFGRLKFCRRWKGAPVAA
jgi:hypothetical protein